MTKFAFVRNLLRSHIWGLALLIGLLIISHLAVKFFMKPGQMSVIEAQAMDMTAMKPPVGAVPVATEIVNITNFNSKVSYTGSVAPYTEQNIYPRIEGWLTGLNVYNGDKVGAGQLLAVLGSPDIQTRLREASYGHVEAMKEISTARSNLSQMRAERNASYAEVSAAEQDINSAQARVSAADHMTIEAEKDLKSAKASLDYWKAEFKRQGNLLKKGAVSQQEYDSEKEQFIAAEAEVENKQSKLEEVQENANAARAEVKNKQAMLIAAKEKALASDAAFSSAANEIDQKVAAANMAGAARETASTFNQYREIRAPFSGIVTKRLINSGVLVNPGMAILNIVQIDKVRLQANVAEQDINGIEVGAEVTAHDLKEPDRVIKARVTSISPLADQTSRTAVVEAIVDNKDHRLIPGDFITMDIATSSDSNAITVPSSALTTKNGLDAVWITRFKHSNGKTVYSCTMHPDVISDKPGLCPKCGMKLEPTNIGSGKTAFLVEVTAGKTDGERTEILSGLKKCDEVIYSGYNYLREGDFVYPTKWGESGPEQLPPPPGKAMNMDDMPSMQGNANNSSPSMNENEDHKMDPSMKMQNGQRMESNSSKIGNLNQYVKPVHVKKSSKKLYTCPMHPDFITDNPNALCPKCGMKVVPKKN